MDTEELTIEEAARDLASVFDTYWNHITAKHLPIGLPPDLYNALCRLSEAVDAADRDPDGCQDPLTK